MWVKTVGSDMDYRAYSYVHPRHVHNHLDVREQPMLLVLLVLGELIISTCP